MADAANLHIRRPKSMFILRAMWKKAVLNSKKNDAHRIAFSNVEHLLQIGI